VYKEGNLIVSAEQNNLPVLSLYCSSFLMCDVYGEFGLISVHLFNILPAIFSREVEDWLPSQRFSPMLVVL